MTDMDAFDRLIAREVVNASAPPRPVDDAAIFTAITATQSPMWRFQSMFSATRFVVAGAIVALFGGFLLSGVLTQQPSDEPPPPAAASASASAQAEPTDATTSEPEPTTAVEADTSTVTPDLLPGVDLVTEEVEPGVYQVVSDGVRELSWTPWRGPTPRSYYDALAGAIAVGPSGEVWNFTVPGQPGEGCRTTPESGSDACTTFYRLGAPQTHVMEARILGEIPAGTDAVDVTAGGTVWAAVFADDPAPGREVRSFDGEAWTTRRSIGDYGYALRVVAGRDGAVWALWTGSGGQVRLGRFTEGEWSTTVVTRTEGGLRPSLVPGADGEVNLVESDGTVRRVEDLDRWPVVARADTADEFDMPRAGGGMVWWVIRNDKESNDVVRFDGTREARFDVVPDGQVMRVVGVGSDGAAWLAGQIDQGGCDGIIRHDGSDARRFLAGTCPVAVDLAPDGSVWLQAFSVAVDPPERTVDLYVVTPEAVMVAE